MPPSRTVIRRQRGLLPLLIASVLWGVWTTGEKFGLAGMSVVTLLAVTLASSTALLWAIMLRRGHERPSSDQLKLLALLGLFEPMLGYGAISLGLAHLDASEAALRNGTEAVFIVALVALLSRRMPTGRAVAGVALAAVGVAVLGGPRVDAALAVGSMLVLAGSLAAAIATMIAARAVADMDPLVVTAYQFGFGLLFAVPLLVWQWSTGDSALTPSSRLGHWLVVIVVCGFGLAIAYLLYNRAITEVSVSAAGVVLNIIPVFGVAAAIVFLGEGITLWEFIGASLIIGGVFLFTERDLNE
ncbi:DMT family transporter [Streptomyces sp. H10-C2]|uniref:DMT family transporter n=1 Tax=unclassified Streptomyces TaxID=2593676 RepID=UPI0024B96325|nr:MULTISPECIES: DMT family transporter [unclassified Streptomyces]MDJ0342595.1 DMT family transporter [Streptomyces sp. PH10-H1]MDJ0368551.1 DMT family transporter [Streptomyces sp. H10-C2]